MSKVVSKIICESSFTGFIYRLHGADFDVCCSSISHARALQKSIESGVIVIKDNKPFINPSLFGYFNKLLLKYKLSKPLNRQQLDCSIIYIKTVVINLENFFIVADNKTKRITSLTSLDDLFELIRRTYE
jgi:hypothetical protein